MNLVELQRNETCDRVYRGSEWLTASLTQTDKLRLWEAEGKIFWVDHNGTRNYAKYQFNSAGTPLPVIAQILLHLQTNEPWAIAAWFEYPNSWISESNSAASPKDMLDKEELVLRAATCHAGSYVA